MYCARMEEAVEAFVELGTLIVEGRLNDEVLDRGFKEGPHCEPTAWPDSHSCDPADFLCMRAEILWKHIGLLATNALPLCVEVLLCPDCQCGTDRARNPDLANIVPPSTDLLLEQWTVTMASVSGEPCKWSLRALNQAVRSQLHFSQLTAWLTSSHGAYPKNVCYRLTMPGEAFASQFSRPPIHHTFPPAAVGSNTQVKVVVKTLPRLQSPPPPVQCAACTPETNVRKRSLGLEQPLLGESLLDPPGPSTSQAHAGLCRWHTGGSPPSPPRRRPTRPVMARRSDKQQPSINILPGLVDDRMKTNCNRHGKHCRCEEEVENEATTNKINLDLSQKEMAEVLTVLRVRTPDSMKLSSQSHKVTGKGDLLLSAILRTNQTGPPNLKNKTEINQNTQNASYLNLFSSLKNTNNPYITNYNMTKKLMHRKKNSFPDAFKQQLSETILPYPDVIEFKVPAHKVKNESSLCSSEPTAMEHNTSPDIWSWRSNRSSTDDDISAYSEEKSCLSSVPQVVKRFPNKERLSELKDVDDVLLDNLKLCDLNKGVEAVPGKEVPSASEKARFRQSLDDAASMVFHSRTGLPLTSSPAPLRRASTRFDFDSSINSVSAIRSAFYGEDRDRTEEAETLNLSPQLARRELLAAHHQSPGSALLGSFEESVLNGRLEPVSTVHGFTTDLGASGSFCPAHVVLPVTVFFYTLGDIDKVSSPYLAHINLGKKGYTVPRVGTIQVTLLNPMGTVIKMFVVLYDLTDMPNNSHTFVRQRTLYMPNNVIEPLDNSQKYLRYLIHLRFASSKSGRVSLHTDIRMIIFRKSDMDTATGHGVDSSYELRSFTYGPTNPKFSPRNKCLPCDTV